MKEIHWEKKQPPVLKGWLRGLVRNYSWKRSRLQNLQMWILNWISWAYTKKEENKQKKKGMQERTPHWRADITERDIKWNTEIQQFSWTGRNTEWNNSWPRECPESVDDKPKTSKSHQHPNWHCCSCNGQCLELWGTVEIVCPALSSAGAVPSVQTETIAPAFI